MVNLKFKSGTLRVTGFAVHVVESLYTEPHGPVPSTCRDMYMQNAKNLHVINVERMRSYNPRRTDAHTV